MNIKVTDPLIAIPTAIVYGGLGAMGSGIVFNKLSHLVEYALNKTFGDYDNPIKYSNRVFISMPLNQNRQPQDYYYFQNFALAMIVAATSSIAVQILVQADYSSLITTPLLVGSVATPIAWGLINMILRYEGGHRGRWVELSDTEIQNHGIDRTQLETDESGFRAYTNFGDGPEYVGRDDY